MEHKTASPGLKGAVVGGSLGAIGGAIHGSKEKGFSMDTPRLRRRKQLTGAASGALGGAMFGALIGNHAKLLKKANKDNEMTRTKEASGLKGALIGGGLGAAYGGVRGYAADRSTKKGTKADKDQRKWNTAIGAGVGGMAGGVVGHALGKDYARIKRQYRGAGRGGGRGYSYNSSGERVYDSDFGGGFTPAADTSGRTKVMKAHGLDPYSFKTKKEFKSKVRAAKFKTHPDRNQGSEESKKKFQDLMDAEKKFTGDEGYYSKLAKLRVGDIEDDLGTYLGTKDEAKARKMIAKAKSKSFSMRHPYLTGIPTLGIAPAIANDRAKNKIVRKMLRGSKSLQKGHRKHKKRQHAEYLAERKLDIDETRANAPARAAASLGAAGLGMANAKYQYKREKMESKKKTAAIAPPPAKKAIIGAFSRLKRGPGKASAKDAIRKAHRAKLDRALPMGDPRPVKRPKRPTVKVDLSKKVPNRSVKLRGVKAVPAQEGEWLAKNERMFKGAGLQRLKRIATSIENS